MIKNLYGITVLVAAALVWTCGYAQDGLPQRIEIFTDSITPVAGAEEFARLLTPARVRYYNLDAPREMQAEISRGLPTDPERAKVVALKRIQDGGTELALKLVDTWHGVIAARGYDLAKYPAIVFDGGAAVVYGVTDLKRAVVSYRRWRTESKTNGAGP